MGFIYLIFFEIMLTVSVMCNDKNMTAILNLIQCTNIFINIMCPARCLVKKRLKHFRKCKNSCTMYKNSERPKENC